MTFIILVLAVAALVSAPYVIIVLKRRKMIKRITFVAHKNGYRVRPLHRMALLSTNRSPRYDYLFESKEEVYAVKLWSATRSDSTLYVRADGAVTQRSGVPSELSADGGRQRSVGYGTKRLKKTRQNFKIKKDKPLTSILLFYPPHKRIVFVTPKSRKDLGSGDMLFDKQICLPYDFERMLSK